MLRLFAKSTGTYLWHHLWLRCFPLIFLRFLENLLTEAEHLLGDLNTFCSKLLTNFIKNFLVDVPLGSKYSFLNALLINWTVSIWYQLLQKSCLNFTLKKSRYSTARSFPQNCQKRRKSRKWWKISPAPNT